MSPTSASTRSSCPRVQLRGLELRVLALALQVLRVLALALKDLALVALLLKYKYESESRSYEQV